MGSKGWGFSSADVGVIIGAGFQTGVYKSSQSSTERFKTFKRLGIFVCRCWGFHQSSKVIVFKRFNGFKRFNKLDYTNLHDILLIQKVQESKN